MLLLPLLLCAIHISRGEDVGEPSVNALTAEECRDLPDPEFLQPGILPTTALASFQGSGNTWVRQILAGATGYKTGDIYKSYGDDKYPEFSSFYNQSVIAIKTHTYSDSITWDLGFKRALLIVRHPLDALYSEFNRMYGGNKTGYADETHLVNEDGSLTWKWDAWMTHISSWIDFYKYWLEEFRGPIHIIYYNNLKRKTHSELESAVRFLGQDLLDVTRLDCTVKYPKPAYFKRTNTAPPVSKYHLFRLSVWKARRAVTAFDSLVRKRFGEKSDTYKRLDIDISVQELVIKSGVEINS